MRSNKSVRLFLSSVGLLILFSAQAQTVCDSVEVESITYTPFSDTAVQVTVVNYSSDIFPYPGFILFDQNGDTLAKEVVNFFGIGSQSSHMLLIHDNANMPSGSFTATLELWTGFYQQLACTWTFTTDLCPTEPCVDVVVDLGNFGGALINSTFDWMITDTLQNGIASGTFLLADSVQWDMDTICLPPGHYMFWVDSLQPTGGQPYFGVSSGVSMLNQQLIQGGGNQSIAFDLFVRCTNISQSVIEVPEQDYDISLFDGTLVVQTRSGRPIGSIEVFDVKGRAVLHDHFIESRGVVNFDSMQTGVYLIRVENSHKATRIFID